MYSREIKIGNAKLNVATARSKKQQEKGLMHIKGLSCNHGMLFEYPKEQFLSFWMKNTSIPLSIAFIDKNKKILEIIDMEPLSEKSIKSSEPVKWALETNRGWFQRNQVSVGDIVEISPESLVKIRITKQKQE